VVFTAGIYENGWRLPSPLPDSLVALNVTKVTHVIDGVPAHRELYDYETDPLETLNLAYSDNSHASLVAELSSRMHHDITSNVRGDGWRNAPTYSPAAPPVPPSSPEPPSTPPSPTCTPCDNTPSGYMAGRGLTCDTWAWYTDSRSGYCTNPSNNNYIRRFCRRACYDAGTPYPGDDCCPQLQARRLTIGANKPALAPSTLGSCAFWCSHRTCEQDACAGCGPIVCDL
jgi:hypothetical protein